MLRFDGWQRYETVTRILTGMFSGTPCSVLDVGGGTGQALDLPKEWSLVSLDVRTAPYADFVCGSADRLPFKDGAFDIAVCLDTLEHLPTANRRTALMELSRVARSGVVITAPFESVDVRSAEKTVSDLHFQVTGQPHRWLSEHLATPLPDLTETCGLFESMGWQVATVPCGYLPVWLLFMLGDQILETLEEGMDIAERMDRLYREQIYPDDLCKPAYRTIVVAAKETTALSALPDTCDPSRLASGMCQAALSLLVSALAPVKGKATEDTAESPASSRRYIERLEQAIETWETAYGEVLGLAEQGHRRMAELERRRSFQLYRWIMRLLSRDV
ncbi:MAG: class I SAM-dependent methyltransferase [bacterium]